MRRDATKEMTAAKAGLKGPVKQVMQVWYKASLKKGEAVQGKIENDSFVNARNLIVTYDRNGNKIKEDIFGNDSGHTYYFNEKGQKIAENSYDKNRFLYHKTFFTYNEDGNILEQVTKNADDSLYSKTVHTYNKQGKEIENVHYFGLEQRVLSRKTSTYSETGNLLSTIQRSENKEFDSDHYNTYNERGLLIESKFTYCSPDKKQYNWHRTSKYNEHDDCIEQTTYDPDGSVKLVIPFNHQYDSEGKRIIPKTVPYDPFPKQPGETEEFVNDAWGNWIKKTEFTDGIPTNIIIRQISYYDKEGQNEETPPFVHPLTFTPEDKKEDTKETVEEMTTEQLAWIAEAPGVTPDNFSIYRYYVAKFKEIPSSIVYTGPYIEAIVLQKELEDNLGAQAIHTYYNIWNGNAEHPLRYTLEFPNNPGYLLQAIHISHQYQDEFVVFSSMLEKLHYSTDLHFSQLQFLRPVMSSEKCDKEFEDEVHDYINRCCLRKKPEKPVIFMIEVEDKGFTMQSHPVDDDFQIKDLDINYGYGFQKFHNDLMHRFNTSTKGLVLFHGEPGTGKTYYIRHLLRSMVSNNKVVIYMPPNMVDHLVEPAFMTFLVAQVKNWSAEGFFCVLLIEDAEPLLAKRQQGVRIQGITNLLNMSDGLLNDMLNLQIICTFNVDLKKLDSALLRPGRLIARKEFKALSELDANLLAQRLGIKHHFTGPATLGEIYAMLKNKNTIVHDVEPDRDSSTIIDDLI